MALLNWRAGVMGMALAFAAFGAAQDGEGQKPDALANLSIEDLMNIEVTTSSKKAENLFDVPAAVYVISSEEIKASGARYLPDLLRMVPGVQVQQTNSNQWMVASRGFVDTFTNKLLVMIDGRSIYTPAFGGVDWATHDLIMDDIERIEVIRGPGGSLWGANAVNGIINIITKSAADTVGTHMEFGMGSLERFNAGYRYGVKSGENAAWRFYTKYRQWDDTPYFFGNNWDAGNDRRAGLRYDEKKGNTSLTISADAAGSHYGQTPWVADQDDPVGLIPVRKQYNPTSYSLLARMTKTLEDGEQSVQAYFDHASRNIIDLTENRDTLDLEAQRSLKLGDKASAVFGGGYRMSRDKTNGSDFFYFEPDSKTLNYWSLFGQYERQISEKTKAIVGAKFERNDYTGWEVQPSLRLLHTPDANRTYWASVTRAVRTPTRFDRESFDLYYFDPDLQEYNTYIGSSDFDSEKLVAYEAGMRLHPSPSLLLDIAAFYNEYDDLRATMPGANFPYPPDPSVEIQPNYIVNGFSGTTSGIEIYGKWDASKNARVFFSYSYLNPKLRLAPGLSSDPTINIANTPRHLASIVLDLKLAKNLNLDLGAYYQDAMTKAFVQATTRLDVNFRYRPTADLEAILSIQRATDQRRFEGQTTDFTYASSIPRSIYFGIKVRR